eukprot:4532262-Amphidinium_carterae.1
MTTTIDQADDQEVVPMSEADSSAAFKRLKTLMGTWPAKGEEPTAEQLAAIQCRVDQHKPPY